MVVEPAPEAMFRRYNRANARFEQPDPYDGSYSLSDPQSLNRYSYVQNDPVNFVDPSGLLCITPGELLADFPGSPEVLTAFNWNWCDRTRGAGGV